MLFARPSMLLLLAIPVLLGAWEVWRRGRRAVMPFDHLAHRKRPVLRAMLLGAHLLPEAVLACVILLLAGPQQMGSPRQTREVTNIELCLDVSGSMGSTLGAGRHGSRYEAAMEAITSFTESRRGDACGLTIFGGESVRWTPITKDLDAIRLATPFLDPSRMPPHMGSTRIGAALRSCLVTLSTQEEGDRLIVLISDGVSSDLNSGEATNVGNELRAANITLHAIHIGGGAAPAQLYEVVSPTGGQVFAADDPVGLQRIFDHIDEMQPAKLKPVAAEPIDWFTPFAFAGLAFIGLFSLTSLGLRYTPW